MAVVPVVYTACSYEEACRYDVCEKANKDSILAKHSRLIELTRAKLLDGHEWVVELIGGTEDVPTLIKSKRQDYLK